LREKEGRKWGARDLEIATANVQSEKRKRRGERKNIEGGRLRKADVDEKKRCAVRKEKDFKPAACPLIMGIKNEEGAPRERETKTEEKRVGGLQQAKQGRGKKASPLNQNGQTSSVVKGKGQGEGGPGEKKRENYQK